MCQLWIGEGVGFARFGWVAKDLEDVRSSRRGKQAASRLLDEAKADCWQEVCCIGRRRMKEDQSTTIFLPFCLFARQQYASSTTNKCTVRVLLSAMRCARYTNTTHTVKDG